MTRNFHYRRGYTLIELLMIIAIMAIVAAALIPSASNGIGEQLDSGARVLAMDLDYVRTLAVTHGSNYRATFNTSAHTWTLSHSGTDTTLTALPASPFHSSQEPVSQRTTYLRTLPGTNVQLSVYSVYTQGTSQTAVSDVEFGPLGSTTRSDETVIWLSGGDGRATRYVPVRINPVTGLAMVGNFQSTAPARPAATGTGVGSGQAPQVGP